MNAQALRIVAVVDGTGEAAGRQAAALDAFLRDGLTAGAGEGPAPGAGDSAAAGVGGSPAAGAIGGVSGTEGGDPQGRTRSGPESGGEGPVAAASLETLVFYSEAAERERLLGLSPTRDVRLVRTGPCRVDLMLERLAREARGEEPALFLFASGPVGTELAARLARRSGGTVLTEALDAAIGPAQLVCRRNVYSGHMKARFALTGRPWCVTIDAGWYDDVSPAGVAHRVLSDDDETGAGPPPFDDVELLAPSPRGDLAGARFLVVAGYGAGGPEGVERIAAAARRMGADFGVTRPVAVNAWAPMDRLIGVSGTRAAPVLCVVAGASGAPGFQWGIEKAGVIVAVNPDERAAIAGNADAVVRDDGVAVVEALADIVAAERTRGGGAGSVPSSDPV